LKKENGRIYITDKTGRIFEVLRKGILQNDEILWKPKNKGTYFLVLETKNKRIIKKINIIK
jgi:sugar lactone lactonase YvrE